MCSHLEKVAARDRAPVTPGSLGCQECLADGDSWVHLRLCLTCGHVGCCDSSPNHHATRHHHATKHPVMRSFEPGETWAWCFVDDDMVEALPSLERECAPRHYEAPGHGPH